MAIVSDFSFSNPDNPFYNPFYRNPDHPNFNRRAHHHDYTRPAKYLITILKNPILPTLSSIAGNASSKKREDITINLSSSGFVIPDTIQAWNRKYPTIYIPEYVIMPDHIHICMDVCAHLPYGLSNPVSNLMGMISKAYHNFLSPLEQPNTMLPFFSKGFNDRIAYSQQQWLRQIDYTIDNPRRYLLKKDYPDYLLKRWLLTIPGGLQFILKGNIFLLKQPFLFRVKTSRHYSQAEADKAMHEWKSYLYNGGIPISPFIHPHEKALKEIAIREGFSFIRICTNGFGERETASGKEFELLSQGRLLLIGQSHYNSQKEDLRYNYAQILNTQAASIAEACNNNSPLSIRVI